MSPELLMPDPQLLADLRRDEGVDRYAYQDSLGFWTIGIGRLIDRRKGGGLRDDEINYLLANDVAEIQAALDKRLPWWRDLDPVRQRALQNMAFNIGVGGLVQFADTLVALQQKRWDDAATGCLASRWATQVGDRAKRIAEMFRTGSE